MKISSKSRYGLRALVDLAANSENENITIKSIAKRQEISENYTENIFSELRRAGIVRGKKGSQGGYVLIKEASNLKIGDVIRAIEGPIKIIDDDANENAIDKCIRKNVWNKIDQTLNDFMDSITLEDLVKEYKRVNNIDAFMYYI